MVSVGMIAHARALPGNPDGLDSSTGVMVNGDQIKPSAVRSAHSTNTSIPTQKRPVIRILVSSVMVI
ncbi:hypothetical protein CARN8_1620002 [mine drainage metagenome]|uniref:Uncharacterized protein n=1 Tax=mine drainage metagenome TaxID=410659 RepID=A0A3P3ZM50_9ZZZZ